MMLFDCIPFRYERIQIEIRVPQKIRFQTKSISSTNSRSYLQTMSDDILHITISEDENITFRFLENEVISLYYEHFKVQLKYIHGFKNIQGYTIRKEADLWSTCSNIFKPSFLLVTEGPINSLLNDSHLRNAVAWLGFSISLLGRLMQVSVRWRRVFSSNECWKNLSLNYAYLGRGVSGYAKWLEEDSGLPAYNALRVLSISLTNSRLRIWLGNETCIQNDSPSWLSVFRKYIGTDAECDHRSRSLVIMVSFPESGVHQMHRDIHLLLPDSVIDRSKRMTSALLPTDVISERLQLGDNGHSIRVEVPAKTKLDNQDWKSKEKEQEEIHNIGDDRLQFVSFVHIDKEAHMKRIAPLLHRARGIVFCINIKLLPDFANMDKDIQRVELELRTLYNTYCRNYMSDSAETDGAMLSSWIHANTAPLVVFVSMDVEAMKEQLTFANCIAHCISKIASTLQGIIKDCAKGNSLGSSREWWVQPCCAPNSMQSDKKRLENGFIAGLNYLLRAMPNT